MSQDLPCAFGQYGPLRVGDELHSEACICHGYQIFGCLDDIEFLSARPALSLN